MKRLIIISLLCASTSAGYCQTAVPSGRPITLDETFKLALAKSETLAGQGKGVIQLEAFERQLKSLFRPTLSLGASETLADKQPGRAQSSVSMDYSIFDGMRDYIAAKAAGLNTEAARLQLERAGQVLYLNAALAYINLTNVRQELSVRQEQLDVSNTRIKQLLEWVNIGRSRESELFAARAQLALDEAARQDAMSRENLAQLELRFLTGLEENLAPELIPLPEHRSIEPYLVRAQKRFDVQSARKALEAAKLNAEIQAKLVWPSLSLGADYYLKRPSPDQDSKWNTALTLQIPLYTGGFAGAAVDQASAREAAAGLVLKLAARQADTDVKEAYSTLEHSMAVMESLKTALGLADENAKYQAKDYTLGLVTNLDVLSAQNTLLQTKLQLETARSRASLGGVQLEVAGGGPDYTAEAK